MVKQGPKSSVCTRGFVVEMVNIYECNMWCDCIFETWNLELDDVSILRNFHIKDFDSMMYVYSCMFTLSHWPGLLKYL